LNHQLDERFSRFEAQIAALAAAPASRRAPAAHLAR
jgi:hypothetical protein